MCIINTNLLIYGKNNSVVEFLKTIDTPTTKNIEYNYHKAKNLSTLLIFGIDEKILLIIKNTVNRQFNNTELRMVLFNHLNYIDNNIEGENQI